MRFAILILILAGVGALVLAAPSPETAAPVRGVGTPVASCASAGCHGGGEVGRRFSEQSTWDAGDPHAKAYRVLFNDVSETIVKNLHRTKPGPLVPAYQDRSCLACHTAGTDAGMTEHASDGVGCDGCHGPSRDWVAKHYEPGWKLFGSTQKASLGFHETKDLVSRITACTGCHIGEAGRDVNHDLIAAGHPRLAFEYTRFHFRDAYKKHWTEPLPNRDFEVRAWFLGQVINLRAALALSADHADRTWPELSEQSCFACHKSLQSQTKGSDGEAAWQAWNTALFDVLHEYSQTLFPGTPPLPLERIQQVKKDANAESATAKLMSGYGRTVPLELDLWLNAARKAEVEQPNRTVSDQTLMSLAKSIAASGAKAAKDWDAAVPHYLALAALHHAAPKLFEPWQSTLGELRQTLKYKAGYNSPADYQPATAQALFDRLGKLK